VTGDRSRWNARYQDDFSPSFRPHPLAGQAPAMSLPDGPVADLACGPSGSALLAAAAGREVTAVDISEVALRLLAEEARRRALAGRITLVHTDLAQWRPEPGRYALVLCTGYWDRAVFGPAVDAVAPGGLLAWQAYTIAARQSRPSLPAEWCLRPGQPATLLPPGFEVIETRGLPGDKRSLLARRQALSLRAADGHVDAG
jgi:SAM-dependent methyltransferase